VSTKRDYSNVREEILDRWHQGQSAKDIKTALGLPRSQTVSVIVGRARIDKDPRAHRRGKGNNPFYFHVGICLGSAEGKSIKREADKRGTTPSELAVQILNCVGTDNLFAAVLDQ
jgi:hypothetical protein